MTMLAQKTELAPSRGGPHHLDRVQLQVDVETGSGVLPRGARGTVVLVWDVGFSVEFTVPFPALVNLRVDQVALASA